MAYQTLHLPTSWFSKGTNYATWIAPDNNRFQFDNSFASNKFFAELRLTKIDNANVDIELRIAANQTEAGSDTGDTLGTKFNSQGSIRLLISQLLDLRVTLDDSTEPYTKRISDITTVTILLNIIDNLSDLACELFVTNNFIRQIIDLPTSVYSQSGDGDDRRWNFPNGMKPKLHEAFGINRYIDEIELEARTQSSGSRLHVDLDSSQDANTSGNVFAQGFLDQSDKRINVTINGTGRGINANSDLIDSDTTEPYRYSFRNNNFNNGLYNGMPNPAAASFRIESTHLDIPPTVEITTQNQIIDPGTQINLTANTADADGTVDSHQWSGSGTFVDSTQKDTMWIPPTLSGAIDEVFILRLTATDNEGLATWDEVYITVRYIPPNEVPSVSIDPVNQVLESGGSVDLMATATDPDGSIASYLWTGQGIFDNATQEDTRWTAPTVTGDQNASFVLRLTATDDDGESGFAEITIQVRPMPMVTVPSVSIDTAAQTIDAGAELQLNATVEIGDSPITTISWQVSLNLVVGQHGLFNNAAIINPIWTAPSPLTETTYKIDILVFDQENDGAVASVNITVRARPSPPPDPIRDMQWGLSDVDEMFIGDKQIEEIFWGETSVYLN